MNPLLPMMFVALKSPSVPVTTVTAPDAVITPRSIINHGFGS